MAQELKVLPPIDREMFAYPHYNRSEDGKDYYTNNTIIQKPKKSDYARDAEGRMGYEQDLAEWELQSGFKEKMTKRQEEALRKAIQKAPKSMYDESDYVVHQGLPRPFAYDFAPRTPYEKINPNTLSRFQRGESHTYQPYVPAEQFAMDRAYHKERERIVRETLEEEEMGSGRPIHFGFSQQLPSRLE